MTCFGILGLLWSQRQFVQALSNLDPVEALFVIYGIAGFVIYLCLGGLRFGPLHMGLREVMGLLMLLFAFQIVVGGISSPWAYHASGKEPDAPSVIYASEDGVVYWLLYRYTSGLSYPLLCWNDATEFTAFLTYTVVPVSLLCLSSLLLTPREFEEAVAETL